MLDRQQMTDHDLLIRIDERTESAETHLATINGRLNKHDEQFKRIWNSCLSSWLRHWHRNWDKYSLGRLEMSKFIPQNFNDLLCLILVGGIITLWILQGFNTVCLPSEVVGALIATWTLVVQFYFRKTPG